MPVVFIQPLDDYIKKFLNRHVQIVDDLSQVTNNNIFLLEFLSLDKMTHYFIIEEDIQPSDVNIDFEQNKTNIICKTISKNRLNDILTYLQYNPDFINPRKLTNGNKLMMRQVYTSWKQRQENYTLPFHQFFTVKPQQKVVFSNFILKNHACHFQHIDKIFDFNHFAEPRHEPPVIGVVEDKQTFDQPLPTSIIQPQDMPIAFPSDTIESYEYRIPLEFLQYKEVLQKVIDTWHSLTKHPEKYFCYLSISYDIIEPFKTQRRPGIHSDGFQSARVSPKELGEYAFITANVIPPVFYLDSIDFSNLNPAKENFFEYYAKHTTGHPVEMKGYEIRMMDPYCMHSAMMNTDLRTYSRHFIRIQFSTRIYDRIGNTKNPYFDYDWEFVRREAQLDL